MKFCVKNESYSNDESTFKGYICDFCEKILIYTLFVFTPSCVRIYSASVGKLRTPRVYNLIITYAWCSLVAKVNLVYI